MALPVLPRGVELRPLGPALGAEVDGLDLRRSIPAPVAAWLREALQRHHFLCVRGQVLDEEQQVAASACFGPLETFPERQKTRARPTFYNVANVAPDGGTMAPDDPRLVAQKLNELWHTDSSYRFVPSRCSLLLAIEALPGEAEGGETEFSNMFLAYEALPEASHPLVRVHPDRGGLRSLFMTANTGAEVSGLGLEEGRALHAELVRHVSQPGFCLRHRWRAGDLMVWDNRCLLHRGRPYDASRFRRVARRTTVAGDGPVAGPR
jgi:taurine dioxygenase/alpha-ketoglutarate-dependent 2,4-dichlorophenoxyacetate dioxygenase